MNKQSKQRSNETKQNKTKQKDDILYIAKQNQKQKNKGSKQISNKKMINNDDADR